MLIDKKKRIITIFARARAGYNVDWFIQDDKVSDFMLSNDILVRNLVFFCRVPWLSYRASFFFPSFLTTHAQNLRSIKRTQYWSA